LKNFYASAPVSYCASDTSGVIVAIMKR